MEVMFFRIVLDDRSALLLCGMYRPPRQGPASLQYLTKTLDELMLAHRCRHVMVVGDLNHHLKQGAYENLLTVQGPTDHVTFPTHKRVGTLDPVITDLYSPINLSIDSWWGRIQYSYGSSPAMST